MARHGPHVSLPDVRAWPARPAGVPIRGKPRGPRPGSGMPRGDAGGGAASPLVAAGRVAGFVLWHPCHKPRGLRPRPPGAAAP